MIHADLSDALISALDVVTQEIGESRGVEAAQIAVTGLRNRVGPSVYPSVYRLDTDRLWLIAQAGYSGVFDGIGLDRGVMATAVLTGQNQFVADASQVPDYLFAQPGFVSEVTCLSGDFVFNIETTQKLDDAVVEPVARFSDALGARLMLDRESFGFGPVAHALGPMLSLRSPDVIAEYAARVTATQLGLDVAQAVVFDEQEVVSAYWRKPGTSATVLDIDTLSSAVDSKRAYASWIGPATDVCAEWDESAMSVVVPIMRRGLLIGGLIGMGNQVPANADTRATIAAISTHTAACLERAALEASLFESLAERSRFMAKVSHELRTPMTAIVGFADLLLSMDDAEPDELVEFLTAIRDSSAHVLDLIGDILDVVRAEAGHLRIDTASIVDFPEVLSEAIGHVRPQLAKADTTIAVTGESRLEVRGDPLRIRQIVVNLLSNAVKFTRHGHIGVSVAVDGSMATLIIDDDGDGIDDDVLNTLFQPFTGRSVDEPASGTGLGLVISRRLAEAMGGTLNLTSPGSGLGATATLALPLATTSERSAVGQYTS